MTATAVPLIQNEPFGQHRSPVMLEVYAREHAPLVGNAVTRLGL